MERIDPTLAKYSPQRAKALEVLEQENKVNLKQVWENYKKLKDNIVQPSTKKQALLNRGMTQETGDRLKSDLVV